MPTKPRGRRSVARRVAVGLDGGLPQVEVGGSAGSLLGGLTYDVLGGSGTFLVAAAFTALAAVLLAVWRPVPGVVVQEATDLPMG